MHVKGFGSFVVREAKNGVFVELGDYDPTRVRASSDVMLFTDFGKFLEYMGDVLVDVDAEERSHEGSAEAR